MPQSPKARPRTPAATLADSLRRTREDHAAEMAEDYAEALADLMASQGEARVTDLARMLGVSHVTVTRTLGRLRKAGYVTSRPHRSIFLTDAGLELARASRHRHGVVLRFLRAAGVSEAQARRDAEGIEHHVSPETLAAFEKFLRRQPGGRR